MALVSSHQMPASRIRPETAWAQQLAHRPLDPDAAEVRRCRVGAALHALAAEVGHQLGGARALGGAEQEAVALGLPLDVGEVGVDRRGEPSRAPRALPAGSSASFSSST
jgi:hypothetical protein